jgi:hypothetical protein
VRLNAYPSAIFLKRNLHAKLCLERKNPDMARAYKTDVVDNVAIA